MGTRGLIGFIIAAQRHGSYSSGASPSDLGADIVKFILSLSPEEYEDMARLIADITWVSKGGEPPAEIQEKYLKAGFTNIDVERWDITDWSSLLRDVEGADALPAIQSGKLKHMIESDDFLNDSIFCEWAYFIDFENQTLETWTCGKKIDKVTFEALVESGVEGFSARFDEHEYTMVEQVR